MKHISDLRNGFYSYGSCDGREVESHTGTNLQAPAKLLVLFLDDLVPACVSELLTSGKIDIVVSKGDEIVDKFDSLSEYQGVIISARRGEPEKRKRIGQLVREVSERDLLCLILCNDLGLMREPALSYDKLLPKIQWCRSDITSEELYGRLCALLDYRPVFDRIEQYLDQMEKWAFAINNRFEELHQELRLAWRVQQDFLPKNLPQLPQVRFAALYRPASWVSGDIYDIFPLDEKHVGFYVADVVGHGVAAGLMTLFVKRALVTKEILDHSYRLVPPGQALAKLNADLCEMELPEQQFVTACYAFLNIQTRELVLARGGHPFPILIEPSGKLSRIDVSGQLLGVFENNRFPEVKVRLQPGAKVIFITDGLEQAFGRSETSEQTMLEQLSKLAHLPAEEMVEAFQGVLDTQESSLHAVDDITMVVTEIPAT